MESWVRAICSSRGIEGPPAGWRPAGRQPPRPSRRQPQRHQADPTPPTKQWLPGGWREWAERAAWGVVNTTPDSLAAGTPLAEAVAQGNRMCLLLCCQGVGYEGSSPGASGDGLPRAAAACALHPPNLIRDDGWTLFGFVARHERDSCSACWWPSVRWPADGPWPLLGPCHEEHAFGRSFQADTAPALHAPGVWANALLSACLF